jgi:hypothetical protein
MMVPPASQSQVLTQQIAFAGYCLKRSLIVIFLSFFLDFVYKFSYSFLIDVAVSGYKEWRVRVWLILVSSNLRCFAMPKARRF